MLKIEIRVTRNGIDIESAERDLRADEFEILDDLNQQWPQPRRTIGQALRDAHLGREERLVSLLQERGLGELITRNGTLVRDWHEQLRTWVKSWAVIGSTVYRHERYPDYKKPEYKK
jgi:hypothetical protein